MNIEPTNIFLSTSQSAVFTGWHIFVRDFKIRYRRALLGTFWLLMPTILMAITAILVVSRMSPSQVTGNFSIPYPLFLICGLTAWRIFADGVTGPVLMCRRTKVILRKTPFPHNSILVASACYAALGLALNATLVIGLMVFYAWPPAWTTIFLPLIVVTLFLSGLVIGMFLAPISIVYLDIRYGLPVALTMLMFASPVFYAPEAGSSLDQIMSWSPLYHSLNSFRETLLLGKLDDLPILFATLAAAALLIVLINRFYVRAMKLAMTHI